MKVIYCTNQPYNRTLYIDDNIRTRSIDTNASINLKVDDAIEVTCSYFKIYNDFFVDGVSVFNGDVELPEATLYNGTHLGTLIRLHSFLFG